MAHLMRVEEMEDYGYFWLPEDAQADHRVPGVLRVAPSGAVALETFGLMGDEPRSLASAFTASDAQSTRRILGVTRNHGNVTLDGCLRTENKLQSRTRDASFVGGTYRATWLYVGLLYEPEEIICFSRVTFTVEGLDEWLAMSGIRVDGDARGGHATISFRAPQAIALPELQHRESGKIGFGLSIPSAWKETKEARVSQLAYVELSTDELWTADEATRRVMWFRDFLRLAMDQSVAARGLTGYSRDVTEPAPGGGERESEIGIVYEERDQGEAERELLGALMMFQRSDLNDDLYVCLARWFEMYSAHYQPFRLYFSAVDSSRASTVDEKFRQLTEALETLDKALNGASTRKLRKRIQRLTEPFAEHLGLEEPSEEFGRTVARTRNVVVHHIPAEDHDVPRGPELIRITYQCELLLIFHFVAVVTGSTDSALKLIKDREALARRLWVVVKRWTDSSPV